MTRLNATDARCEALFASALQRSDDLTADAVSEAIGRTVRRLGSAGCASRMAQEFGDHPEAACERMRWAREVLSDLPAGPPTPPTAPTCPSAAVATTPLGSATVVTTPIASTPVGSPTTMGSATTVGRIVAMGTIIARTSTSRVAA